MKRFALRCLALCAGIAFSLPAVAEAGVFSFGVISPQPESPSDETAFRALIDESDAESIAFVVASGIKTIEEPCTDKVYQRRKALLNSAKNGVIVSLAASDWALCRNEFGKSTALARLNRLRELLFVDGFSIGMARIPLARQSTALKFRNYAENARWEIGSVMFATINLPANNNHYIYDAGRNSEFEDRLVANRDWLNRVFTFAGRKKSNAVVLFSDGNPLATPLPSTERRDGYVETRKQLIALASKFPGRVLLIHRQPLKQSASAIVWNKNLGELGIDPGWTKLTVDPSASTIFGIENEAARNSAKTHIHSRKGTGDGVALR